MRVPERIPTLRGPKPLLCFVSHTPLDTEGRLDVGLPGLALLNRALLNPQVLTHLLEPMRAEHTA